MPEVTIITESGELQTGTLLTEDEIKILNDEETIDSLFAAGGYGYSSRDRIRKILTKLLQTHYIKARILIPVLTAETIKDPEFQDGEAVTTAETVEFILDTSV